MKKASMLLGVAASSILCVSTFAADISGVVKDASGKPIEGVLVSAIDEALEMSITVYSQADGSYTIDGLADQDYIVRARLIGKEDAFEQSVKSGTEGVSFAMVPAENIDSQRTADNLFSLVKWENEADKQNFKMQCGDRKSVV